MSVAWYLLPSLGDGVLNDDTLPIPLYGYLFYLRYNDGIMGAMASQITSLTIVYSTVYSGADQWKPQSSASLAFVWGIHQWLKMFPFDDVTMNRCYWIRLTANQQRLTDIIQTLYLTLIRNWISVKRFSYENTFHVFPIPLRCQIWWNQ